MTILRPRRLRCLPIGGGLGIWAQAIWQPRLLTHHYAELLPRIINILKSLLETEDENAPALACAMGSLLQPFPLYLCRSLCEADLEESELLIT